MYFKNKRGQVTMYIIIALVIVGAAVLILLFRPQLEGIAGVDFDPSSYLKKCIEPEIKKNVKLLSEQGSYSNIEGFVLHNGEKYKYLCYSSEFYKTCVVQQPALKNNFEKELSILIKKNSEVCINNLKSEYEKRGYTFSIKNTDSSVEIIPEKIIIKLTSPFTISKDTSQTFENFNTEISSQIYEILFIAQSIIDFEATYGDSETSLYIQYYPDISIEKNALEDGTTLYKISNVVSGEQFKFASRSIAWPPGYGLEQ